MYALVQNGIISKYPYSYVHLKQDNPDTSFPDIGELDASMLDELLASFSVYPVKAVPYPIYDKAFQGLRELRPAVVEGAWVQQWEVYPLPAEEVAANQAAAREKAKANRQAVVDAIKVTTQAGNTFDGDETSQTRMVRAIIALQATGTPSVTWVLADNTYIQATAAELSEALALSGAAQAAAWAL